METDRRLTAGDTVAEAYRIVEAAGAGGFSRIFRARDLGLGRDVALKVLDVGSADVDEEGRQRFHERFRREAKLLARLRHPSTVTLHDFGRLPGGRLYMALEFVRGMPLTRGPRRPVPPGRVVDLLLQALGSLAEAHDYGVLHRDIKPSNLMLTEAPDGSDRLKLIDFGIAKPLRRSRGDTLRPLTGESTVLGTPRYVAPEYASDDDPVPASDIYGLGLVAHELLTDRRAVPDGDPMQVLEYHLSESHRIAIPPTPSVPDPLRRIVNRMTERSLQRRYRHVEDLRGDLEALPTFDASYAATTDLRRPGHSRGSGRRPTDSGATAAAPPTGSRASRAPAPDGEDGEATSVATPDAPEVSSKTVDLRADPVRQSGSASEPSTAAYTAADTARCGGTDETVSIDSAALDADGAARFDPPGSPGGTVRADDTIRSDGSPLERSPARQTTDIHGDTRAPNDSSGRMRARWLLVVSAALFTLAAASTILLLG